jgi:hypothetical protein
MSTIAERFDLKDWFKLDGKPSFFAGIECEIESVKPEQNFTNFTSTHDGSLRNDGMEFISNPLPRDVLLSSFRNLHTSIEYYDPDVAFSPRTSTHVHINCRSLTEEQTRDMVLFYALFEEFFFTMVDKHRRTNIHCVPLTETFLPQVYKYDLRKCINNWHKYTALNILPLFKLGTIEFRHLQGTGDDALLDEWVTTLENLWRLCQRDTITATALANPEQIKSWWRELFGHSPRIMALEPALPNMIQNSLIDVKFAFV